ncbi:MAG: hypothetical protein JO276_08370 [Sphingomonadaceae bacterium]|nr:hypothetical protein [Sphingomonadaceae bacterium]
MDDSLGDELSSDGRTLVRWAVSDGRMSHIIRTPAIVDAASGRPILRCGDSGFDATIAWGEEGRFAIDLRHYWRPGTLGIAVDRSAGTFRVTGPDAEASPRPIETLSAFVAARFAASGPPAPAPPRGRPTRWILLLLAAALLLLALLLAR